jgi:predicted nucleic acid-binding protein
MDVNDRDHEASADLFETTTEALLVPAPVLVELDWLGASRGVPASEVTLTAILSGDLHVADLDLEDYERVAELCREYSDMPLGFVDAAVIAIAERERERTVATLDRRHFPVVRPRHVRSLALVPELS